MWVRDVFGVPVVALLLYMVLKLDVLVMDCMESLSLAKC